jgi:CHAT domain-containing protein
VQELDDALRSVQRTSATADGVAFWEIESDLLALYSQTLADADELADLRNRGYDNLTAAEQQRFTELNRRYGEVQQRFAAFLNRPEVTTLLDQIRATTDGQNLDIENQYRALQNNLRALPQATALIYPLILPDRLELVLITADNPSLRYPIAVTGADLNRAIVAMGQALKDPSSDIQPLAQQLYGWLIAPLAPQLEQAGIESIIYAPDGALRYIPLAALHDGNQYLAERFSISHITAVSLTNLNFAPQRDQRRLLAAACAQCSFTITVGDRVFPFGDLPYTATEVNRLAEQVPNTSVLLNRRFSQTELENRLGSFNILHLATHGAVVAEAPRESFLVLGSGETVSLETIRTDWSLSAELVVLSACETAVGSTELGSGVEILGLGYQMQEAGAQAVIASLWQVSDPGTEALMAEFYAALGQGLTKTEALQAAQQALIRNQSAITGGPIRAIALPTAEDGRTLGANAASGYSHPYYWAPFILIGNGL